MENDKPYDPYAKDAQIKEDFKLANPIRGESGIGRDMTQAEGARLRIDAEAKVPFPKNYMIDESCAGQASPLESLEQERNRLSRKLTQTLSENETRIRVLKDMLEGLNRWQKNGYYLRDSINNSSQIQMDQIHQMREYLK
jgi:hypothetical protein